MLTKGDLETLSVTRLEDALYLLGSGRSSSAYYLAGYSIELALKACISKLFFPDIIPDKAFVNAIYTHKLDSLMSIAGLLPEFNEAMRADRELAANWAIVNQWSEESRYQLWDPMSAATLLHSINEPTHGVFQWLKKHW